MKIKLFYVSKNNDIDEELQGIYTEKEFEDFKKELIESYRNSEDYIYNIQDYIDNCLICNAALGREEQVEEFKEAVRIMEEETLDDFINDYVEIYEKEL